MPSRCFSHSFHLLKVNGGDHKLIIRHMITFIKKPKNKLPYFLNIDISKHNLHWIRFLSFFV